MEEEEGEGEEGEGEGRGRGRGTSRGRAMDGVGLYPSSSLRLKETEFSSESLRGVGGDRTRRQLFEAGASEPNGKGRTRRLQWGMQP